MVAHSIVQISYGFTFATNSAYRAFAFNIKLYGTSLEPLPTRDEFNKTIKYNYWNTNRHKITSALEKSLLDVITQDNDLVASGPDYDRDVHLHGCLDHQGKIAVTFGIPAVTMNSECVQEGETEISRFDPGRFKTIESELGKQVVQARSNLMNCGVVVEEIGWIHVAFTV